jgi:L-ascorbate metabolism protein UlaG (beta-lactamase superfamily)
MVDVIKQIQPKIVLPMHYWGRAQLDRFMSQMEAIEHDFIRPDTMSMEIVREQLPEKVTVIALGGDGGG